MRIAIGSDHAGLALKNEAAVWLTEAGHDVEDIGAHTLDPQDDYPDFAEAVAKAIVDGRAERGVLLCGSGVGASIAANKVPGVRAAMCHDTYSAHQGVEHDDMNVLCIGARITGSALAQELVTSFTSAVFSGEERHARRLGKVLNIESRHLSNSRRQGAS
jgi:RpiB/LacA/LacB family sugar-phosphate isomerase